MATKDQHGNTTRTVNEHGTQVTITRLSGTGARRYGDTYRAVTADGRTLGTVTYAGRRGGMDAWAVHGGSTLYGSLSRLTVQYGSAPVSA